MKKEIIFKREKVSVAFKLSKSLVSRYDLSLEEIDEDYLMDMLTARLDAYLFAHTALDTNYDYWLPSPTFLDWVMGRRKCVKINISVKDFKIDPPVMPDDTIRLNFIELTPDEER